MSALQALRVLAAKAETPCSLRLRRARGPSGGATERARHGGRPCREVLAFGTKGGKSVENGEKRSLLEQKGEIQQKEIEFHRISSKFGHIRQIRQFLGDGQTDGKLPGSELEYLVPRPTRIWQRQENLTS